MPPRGGHRTGQGTRSSGTGPAPNPSPRRNCCATPALPFAAAAHLGRGAGQTWATALAVLRVSPRADGSIANCSYHYGNAANLVWVGRAAVLDRGAPRRRPSSGCGDAVNPVDPTLSWCRPATGTAARRRTSPPACPPGTLGGLRHRAPPGRHNRRPLLVVVRGDDPGLRRGGELDNLGSGCPPLAA